MISPDSLPSLTLATPLSGSETTAPVSEADCDLTYAHPLAWLAAIAALVDLVMNRCAVIAMVQLSTAARALALQASGKFPLHLLGISGFIALYSMLARYLRMAGYSGITRRLSLAMTGGVLLPAVAVTIFYAREYIPQSVVFVLVLAAHVVIAIVAGNAARFRRADGSSRERRVVVAAWFSALIALSLLVMIAVRSRLPGWTALGPFSQGLRITGEFSWLLVPWFALPMFQSDPNTQRGMSPRDRIGRTVRAFTTARPGVVAISAALLLSTFMSALAWELRPHVSRLVYSGFRVAVLTERMAVLYLLWVACNIAIGIGLVFHARAATRQMGVAILLWSCAGFGPRAPAQALCLCLAVLLITRVAQSVSATGRIDAMRPWGSRPPA